VNCFYSWSYPCCEKRNERADRLETTELKPLIPNGRAMDHAGVLHALCETRMVEDSLGDDNSNILARFGDGQVKFGTASMNTVKAAKDEW
jgi:hypothetical protein